MSGPAERLVVRVPGRPVSWNAYWAGRHWAARRRHRDEVRARVAAALRAQYGEPPAVRTPVEVRVVVVYRNRRHRVDPDNVCAKPYIDALVAQGVLPDDDPDRLVRLVVEQRHGAADAVVLEVAHVPWT